MGDRRDYIEQRIERDLNTGCWNWKLSVGSHGYGNAYNGKTVTVAHRLSYEAFKGSIPEGKQLDHLCKNRRCVNPDHLEPVSQAINIRRQFGGTEDLSLCPNGHDRSHSFYDSEGSFRCRICRTEASRKHRDKNKSGRTTN